MLIPYQLYNCVFSKKKPHKNTILFWLSKIIWSQFNHIFGESCLVLYKLAVIASLRPGFPILFLGRILWLCFSSFCLIIFEKTVVLGCSCFSFLWELESVTQVHLFRVYSYHGTSWFISGVIRKDSCGLLTES